MTQEELLAKIIAHLNGFTRNEPYTTNTAKRIIMDCGEYFKQLAPKQADGEDGK